MYARDWAVNALWSLSLFAGGCGLLSSGDQLPPALAQEDSLIAPLCLVLSGGVAPAGASISQNVIVTGRRKDSSGAEGVAVSVRVGECDGSDGGSLVAPAGGRLPSGCSGNELPADVWRDIALFPVASGGCTGLSDSELSCLLSPDGNAQFTVQAVGAPLVSSGYIPVCISANAIQRTEAGGVRHDARNQTMGVFFSTNINSSELGINYSAPTSQPGPDCSNLHNCGEAQQVRVAVSLSPSAATKLAGPDGGPPGRRSQPATDAGATDGGGGSVSLAPRDLDIAVAVRSERPSADVTTPYFSTSNCQDSAGTNINVRIAAGSIQSQPFFLCVSSMSSKYFVEAVLVDNALIRGVREIPVTPAVQRIVLQGSDASAENFRAQLCGESGVVAPPGGVFVASVDEAPPGAIPAPNQRSSSSDASADGSPSDAAPGPASDGAPNGSNVIRSARLVLGTGNECTLVISR